MRIYYSDLDGKIIAINYDRDDFTWSNTINISHSILEIDEVDPENKELCSDLISTQSQIDINNNAKYYINNNELYSVNGWEEYAEDEMI